MSYGGGYGGGGGTWSNNSSRGGGSGGTWSNNGASGGGGGGGQASQYAAWAAQAQAYSGAGGGYGGPQSGGYGQQSVGGGFGGPPQAGGGGGFGGLSQSRGGGGGGGDLSSKLQAIASGGGGGGSGFSGSRGGSGRGGYDMKKFAAYQTNKRRFDDRGGRGGGPDAKRDRGEDGPRRERNNKPREGREPELNLFIDKRFNYWNLPVKAKVLLVSNLPQIVCQPDLLYNIFSFYGDIERIKIIRRSNSCALIEFSTATFACIARDHLDQTQLAGQTLVVTFSKFAQVRMPHEAGLPPDPNTKDFSGNEYAKFKRYRTEDLKKNNMRKIIQPTSTIHVSGLQGGKSPNDVKRLFEGRQLIVTECIGVAIKQKKPKENEPPGTTSSGPKMFCYVQFGSVDDALLGLANYGNSVGMRMSFAKDNLETLKKNCIEKKLPLILGDQKC